MDFIITKPAGGGGFTLPEAWIRFPSPQYGPAWVADCYGTTHEDRVAFLADKAQWPDATLAAVAADRDLTARQFANLTVYLAERAVNQSTDSPADDGAES